MYEAIKQSINGEFNDVTNHTSVEKAFETLYGWVTHLKDMDDFSTSQLNEVYSYLNNGKSIVDAFKTMINNSYEFADFNYFEDAINKYQKDLEVELKNAVNSNNPTESWNASVHWLADHAVVHIDGNEYTLDKLQKLLEEV